MEDLYFPLQQRINQMVAAILTADIVGSTQLKKKELQRVHKTINEEFENIRKRFKNKVAHFEMYRGDSLQGIVLNPENALKIAFWLKSSVKKLYFEKETQKSSKGGIDIRISIGVGKIDGVPKNLTEATGEAFLFSGRTLDRMKNKHQKTSLKTTNENTNREFEVHFKFFDLLTDKWSIAAAEVVYYLLQDLKEVEIAKKTGISQSAVNSRKKTSGWEAISKLLARYQETMSKEPVP